METNDARWYWNENNRFASNMGNGVSDGILSRGRIHRRDLKRIREHFIRDGSFIRLGNLASNLLHLSKWIQMGHNDEAIINLMREIAWLMEWSGDLASAIIITLLCAMACWLSILVGIPEL
jgi:hypothetical protein